MNNRPVEPRWGSESKSPVNPAFHAGLLSFNPFGIFQIDQVKKINQNRGLAALIKTLAKSFDTVKLYQISSHQIDEHSEICLSYL
jgi:hypothetical protein